MRSMSAAVGSRKSSSLVIPPLPSGISLRNGSLPFHLMSAPLTGGAASVVVASSAAASPCSDAVLLGSSVMAMILDCQWNVFFLEDAEAPLLPADDGSRDRL